jgi:hypothetical protein
MLRTEQSGTGFLSVVDDESSEEAMSEAMILYRQIIQLFSEDYNKLNVRNRPQVRVDSFLESLLAEAPEKKGQDYLMRNFVITAFKEQCPELRDDQGKLAKLGGILDIVRPTVEAVRAGEITILPLMQNVRQFVEDMLNCFYVQREFKFSSVPSFRLSD